MSIARGRPRRSESAPWERINPGSGGIHLGGDDNLCTNPMGAGCEPSVWTGTKRPAWTSVWMADRTTSGCSCAEGWLRLCGHRLAWAG